MASSGRSPVAALLWNDGQRRLRTPWRLVFAAVVLVLATAGGAALAAPLEGIATDASDPTLGAVAGTLGQATPIAAMVVALALASVAVDRRALADLGLDRSREWWADLGFGLALGTALPLVVLAVELAAGYARVTGTLVSRPDASLPVAPAVSPWLALTLVLGYFVAVGVSEELLFRGYLLVNVAEGLRWFDGVGARGALVGATTVTSVLFGLGHGTNPNATSLAVVLVGLYGALLAASLLLTGRIAVAVGFHVAWNTAVSSVVGFPVSGFTTPVSLLEVEVSGPVLVTGGGFGPEGGLVALVSFAVGAAAIAWWARRREGRLRWHADVADPTLRASAVDRGESAGDDRDE